MRNLVILSGLALLATAMGACSDGENKTPSAPEAIRVKTIEISPVELTGIRSYSGTVEESGGTAVSFPVAGTLVQLNVEEGDRVAKGQVIGTLDASSLRNAYDIAKATLDNAQDAYDRMKKLHDANSVTDMKWVEVQNLLRQAQSGEAIARKAMDDATLRSPVSGYVAEKLANAGMNVAPGVPVIKIVDIDPVKVSVSIPENEVSKIALGEGATIRVKAADDATITGKVVEKAVTANPLSRSYDVKIEVSNPDGKLLPGMICDVVLDGETTETGMVLPMSAVLLDADNQNFVWLDNNGTATRRTVQTGGMTDDGIIITSGITSGDKVITEGQQKVSEGTKIISINK